MHGVPSVRGLAPWYFGPLLGPCFLLFVGGGANTVRFFLRVMNLRRYWGLHAHARGGGVDRQQANRRNDGDDVVSWPTALVVGEKATSKTDQRD